MGSDLKSDLDRWVDAGLLTADQSAAIWITESHAEGSGTDRLPVLGEVLAYSGAALVAAGVVVALGRQWDELSTMTRIGIVSTLALASWVAGEVANRRSGAAFGRLTSVLWVMSVGGVLWAAVIVVMDLGGVEDEAIALVGGLVSAPFAWLLWRRHQRSLQQAALLGLVVMVATAAIAWVAPDADVTVFAAAVWVIGMVWAVGGWRQRLAPDRTALVLGAGLAVWAGIPGDDGWFFGVSIATGIACMVASLPTGELALLGIGAFGVFVSTTRGVLHFFGDGLGVPVTLALVGGVFIVLALVSGGLMRRARGSGRLGGSR